MGKLGSVEHRLEIAGRQLAFEGGTIAQQANGAVVASLGDTKILTTTTTSGEPKEHLPFFPLTIDVEERMYAIGRIPGSFFRREGRPSEGAILAARLVDRPLRPTFVEGVRNEVQVVNTILQTSRTDPYDVLAINASSVATMLAGVPFDGPVAGLRYAMLRDGSWTAFPTFEQLDNEAVFDMVVAGRITEDDDVAILMVEAEATPDAWRLVERGAEKPTEQVLGQALEDVKPILRELCEAQQAFVDKLGRRTLQLPLYPPFTDDLYDRVEAAARAGIEEIYRDGEQTKEQRDDALAELRDRTVEQLTADSDEADGDQAGAVKEAFEAVQKKVVRKLITTEGRRVDGRGPRDIRPLSADVGVLDRVHGSGLFQRGETQVLTVLVLAALREAQQLDTLDPAEEKRYLHHYNMPPFSTGEAGRIGTPKRREVGHGLLAERALLPVIPDEEEWPYTLRLVSEVTSSNGSTSMASVCGSTLALMDGGVPIHAPVAGIAMGLIREDGQFTTLSDIQGVEDFYGDMDFKVAGTREFVTALQLDTKLTGIPADVLQDALLQAKDARMQILDVMHEAIPESRESVAPGAPRVTTIYIPQEKIGEVIGPKGKIIKELTAETGTDIDVEEEEGRGIVRVYAEDEESSSVAVDRINAIANPVVPEAGERYHGTVVKTEAFGAFVNLVPGTDGLLHISKLSDEEGRRLEHAEEAVSVGDKLWVKVLEVLDGGRKFRLGLVKEDAEEAGGETEAVVETTGRDGGDGGERKRDRGGGEGGRKRDRGGGGGGRARDRDSGDGGKQQGDGDDRGGQRTDRGGGDTGETRQRTRTRTRSRE